MNCSERIDARLNSTHLHRPKAPGIWVKVELADGKFVDGLLKNDLLVCEPWKELKVRFPCYGHGDLCDEVAFPRAEVVAVTVLGIIGTGKRARGSK